MKRKELKSIPIKRVYKAAEQIYSHLPLVSRKEWIKRLPRLCEEVKWVYVDGGIVVDLGGSIGLHTSICAKLGMKAICVDNFLARGEGHQDDPYYNSYVSSEKFAVEMGVEFIHTDLLNWVPPFEENSIDVCMSINNIEHLHHSPRNCYRI